MGEHPSARGLLAQGSPPVTSPDQEWASPAPSGLLRAGRAAHALCMKLGDPICPPSRSRPFRGPSCCKPIILCPRGTRGLLPITVGVSVRPPQGAPGALLGLIARPLRAQPLEAGSSVAPGHAGDGSMAELRGPLPPLPPRRLEGDQAISQVGPHRQGVLLQKGPWSRAQGQQGTQSSQAPPSHPHPPVSTHSLRSALHRDQEWIILDHLQPPSPTRSRLPRELL